MRYDRGKQDGSPAARLALEAAEGKISGLEDCKSRDAKWGIVVMRAMVWAALPYAVCVCIVGCKLILLRTQHLLGSAKARRLDNGSARGPYWA